MFTKIKEFLNHNPCWNCKTKGVCNLYKSTKSNKLSFTKCNDKNYCKYCDSRMSHGNDKLCNVNGINMYIVAPLLYILKDDENMASKVKINYCPMCGRKLEENTL